MLENPVLGPAVLEPLATQFSERLGAAAAALNDGDSATARAALAALLANPPEQPEQLAQLYRVQVAFQRMYGRPVSALVAQLAACLVSGAPEDNAVLKELADAMSAEPAFDNERCPAVLVLRALALPQSEADAWLSFAEECVGANPRAYALALVGLSRYWRLAHATSHRFDVVAGIVFNALGLRAASIDRFTRILERGETVPDLYVHLIAALKGFAPDVTVRLLAPMRRAAPNEDGVQKMHLLASARLGDPASVRAVLEGEHDRLRGAEDWADLAERLTAVGAEDAALQCWEKALRYSTAKSQVDWPKVLARFEQAGAAELTHTALLRGITVGATGARSLEVFVGRADPARASGAPQGRSTPLVLVSQIQRSGGTLLERLFDGHAQLRAHPHELKIGSPHKWHWPQLDLSAGPKQWLQTLFERQFAGFELDGYLKADGNRAAAKEQRALRFRCTVLRDEFVRLVSDQPPNSQRDVLDAYFTAFFRAWEGHALHDGVRRVTAFVPRLLSYKQSVLGFRRDYPDGLLVACIREPAAWYVSAKRHHSEYQNLSHAMELWRTSTLSALQELQERPRQTVLLTYEELVSDPEVVMRDLAGRMDIDFEPILLEPTLQGEAILPNSSFDVQEAGIHKRSREAGARLPSAEQSAIERDVTPLYQIAVERIAAARA